jgi:hypothetical protein
MRRLSLLNSGSGAGGKRCFIVWRTQRQPLSSRIRVLPVTQVKNNPEFDAHQSGFHIQANMQKLNFAKSLRCDNFRDAGR